MTCTIPAITRRRTFWATQPDACGSNEVCGADCGIPGLSFTDTSNCATGCQPTVDPSCGPFSQPRSIASTDWMRGLIINMLMTDARNPDRACGYRPGAQGGHWSESYISGGPSGVGTLMRTAGANGSTSESVNLIRAYAVATLEKLIGRGVASAVDVTAKYIGDGKMSLEIVVSGHGDGDVRVGLSGARLQNGWVWN